MAEVQLGRLITLIRRGQRPACVMLAGAGGGLQPYLRLAGVIGETRNVYGIRAAGLVPDEAPEDRIEAMAEAALRALDDAGVTPDLVFGWSMGGAIGWELCVRLAARGVQPDLIMLDSSPLPRVASPEADDWLFATVLGMLGPRPDPATVERVRLTLAAQVAAVNRYRTAHPYAGRVLIVSCTDPDPEREPSMAAWRTLAPQLRETRVDADHYGVFDPAHLPALSAAMAPGLTPATAAVHVVTAGMEGEAS